MRKKPIAKPTKKLIQAHYNAQAPLDAEQPTYKHKAPRKWIDDKLEDVGKE